AVGGVMPTKAWASTPGSFDVLNTSRLFPSDHPLGIPTLYHTPLSAIPDYLVGYRQRIRAKDFDPDRAAVHFFLDDYRFETVWSRPLKALEHLRTYRTLLTPDFSLYADWPLAVQQWNVYRNRWCGRYWQELGFQVIPTVSWSTPESFDFCFAGIPQGSVVAVSAVGVDLDDPQAQDMFLEGFTELTRCVMPSTVLSYGVLPTAAMRLAKMILFDTRWQKHVQSVP
ncbi:MAG: DUF4417 domain-containing protein, partial [Anaerolineae bacterium]